MTVTTRRHKILFTDSDLNVIGRPIVSEYTTIEAQLRFNEPGTCAVELPAHDYVLESAYGPGNRCLYIRNGIIEIAGPIEYPGPFSYRADRDGKAGDGRITVRFADDLALAAGRITYPNPVQASTAQTSARYTISGVNAEDAMRALVNLNAGPGALVARRVPHLILGADTGVGTSVTYSTRFEPLCDALRAVASAGGGLGFRTTQDGTDIVFEVYEPEDLTTSARFSRSLGNIREIEWEPQAPSCTVAIVGGQDAGADRVIRERINTGLITAGWPRLERFIANSGASNATELDTAGDDALAEGAGSSRLRIVAIDTPSQQYRADYNIGDQVSAEVFPGTLVSDILSGVNISVSAEGRETISPIIGTGEEITASPTEALRRQILRRLVRQETGTEVPL